MKRLILLGIMGISLLSFSQNSSNVYKSSNKNYSEIIQNYNQVKINNNATSYSDRLKSYTKSEVDENLITYSDKLVKFSNYLLNTSNSNYSKLIRSFTDKSRKKGKA